MMSFLIALGVVYLVGVVAVPIKDGLSPFEFPAWGWPMKIVGWFKND